MEGEEGGEGRGVVVPLIASTCGLARVHVVVVVVFSFVISSSQTTNRLISFLGFFKLGESVSSYRHCCCFVFSFWAKLKRNAFVLFRFLPFQRCFFFTCSFSFLLICILQCRAQHCKIDLCRGLHGPICCCFLRFDGEGRWEW